MSVDDKETVLPSERPGDASLPPPPQRPTQLLEKCSENHQQPLEKCISKQEGTHSPADRGSEEPEELQELQEPEKHGNDNIDNHTGPDSSTQIQNGVQQPKSQQKLNKRRSTMSSGFKHPVFGKRRRRANSESESVLPTNFYLGGNIFDPLNLNSMLDEEVNQALNAETPKSSPLPVKNRDPVEILIPRDITDPLNLNSSTAGDEGLLLSPLKSGGGGGGRRRHRNRHHGIIGVGGSGGKGVEGGVLPQIGDFSEAEKGKSETEMMLTSTSSEPPLDCVASEPPEKEALESNSISTQGAQCSSALNSSTDGGDSKRDERPTSGAPVLDTSNPTPSTTISPTATPAVPASHRQRKRKRTSSKSENFGATYCDKANKATTITTTSSGSTSTFTSSSSGVGQPQANRNQGTGLQSIQQQHPNQRKNQKNQQKPNQQHHHQQQQQKKKKFQYGNYDKYYGYRNPGLTEDPRLRTLKPEWFRGKEVLDLGCNTGRLTLSIAMNWRPSRIVGLDIDGSLIHAARKNILYFLSEMHVMKSRSGEKDESGDKAEKPETTSLEKNYKSESPVDMEVDKEGQEGEKDGVKEEEEMVERREKVVEKRSEDGVDGDAKKTKGEEEAVSASSASSSNGNCVFPVSLRISRGPIAAPPLPDTKPPSPGNFPANVSFVKGNYVLDSDLLLVTQREEFDVILCLSVTKWVHLNWGDVGLKRLFHRVYRHLRPGGTFILEPQPWNSYSKRKKLTETITKNYYSICLKPEQFSTYLISEVGFSSYELIGTPSNLSRGFQRPIYLFHKGPAPQK